MGLMNLVKDGMVKRIFSHISENVILLLDGSFFRNVNDIVLIFAYVSPDKSPIYTDENDNGIEILSTNIEQIVTEYRDAELFLAGDLNSQIKDFADYVIDDDIDYVFGENVPYPKDSFNLKRKSWDDTYNRFGLSLIELCCTYGIHTVNGRLFSDTDGNFTCLTHNGTSVVDYMLASTNLFDLFTDFGVDDKDDSIHFPLYCQIKLKCNRILDERPQYPETTEIWNTCKWRSELKELFIKKFS